MEGPPVGKLSEESIPGGGHRCQESSRFSDFHRKGYGNFRRSTCHHVEFLRGGLIGTADARWNHTDLSCISALTLADFEPVNVSSLMVSSGRGATSH